jgi:5-carboxymethyl-2-hydroxymuconate isomerase
MPNFIIEFSASLEQQINQDKLMEHVFAGAENCGHFPPQAIKIRTEKRDNYRLHDQQKDFLHVRAHILSGRTDEQKSEISNAVLSELKKLTLSSVFVSVEVVDIHRPSFVDYVYS